MECVVVVIFSIIGHNEAIKDYFFLFIISHIPERLDVTNPFFDIIAIILTILSNWFERPPFIVDICAINRILLCLVEERIVIVHFVRVDKDWLFNFGGVFNVGNNVHRAAFNGPRRRRKNTYRCADEHEGECNLC